MAAYYKWLVLPPHGLNPWEDAVLPPHEPNRWQDYRHEHMSFHYMYSNMRRTLDLPPHELSHWGGLFVEYKECHGSDPLFTTYPSGMSVIQVKDIQPFKCRQTYLIPILLRDRRFIDKVKCKIYTNVQKHANYINCAWLYHLSHANIPNTNISHIQSSSPPNADCRFLLMPVGGISSTCSFLQRSCLNLASISIKDCFLFNVFRYTVIPNLLLLFYSQLYCPIRKQCSDS